jgi:hypothetical protein
MQAAARLETKKRDNSSRNSGHHFRTPKLTRRVSIERTLPEEASILCKTRGAIRGSVLLL